ncbi:hypothetical protein BDW59DRAFT_160978 [Aspergillus cavernicola]|uniref:Uncharacterized protein n=1 Tax=Aspergillus cavernicola TaxID=176166 RepID=A0ABR4IFC0_9EURO
MKALTTLGLLCTKTLTAAVDIDISTRETFIPKWEIKVTPPSAVRVVGQG